MRDHWYGASTSCSVPIYFPAFTAHCAYSQKDGQAELHTKVVYSPAYGYSVEY